MCTGVPWSGNGTKEEDGAMGEFTVQLTAIGWGIVYVVVGGLVGSVMVVIASAVVPKLIDRLTPAIDEQKEIIRGNQAVAEYFGRIVSAGIIGISIVIAAAVLGGIIAGLY
jgi:small-conductance mechanosensitive channel